MHHFQRLLTSSSKEPGCQKASRNQLWSNIQALIREAKQAWRELSCRYPWRKLFRPGTFQLPTWCPRAWRWGNQMLAGDLTSHSERALPVPALGLPSHTSPLSSRIAQRGPDTEPGLSQWALGPTPHTEPDGGQGDSCPSLRHRGPGTCLPQSVSPSAPVQW